MIDVMDAGLTLNRGCSNILGFLINSLLDHWHNGFEELLLEFNFNDIVFYFKFQFCSIAQPFQHIPQGFIFKASG